MVIEKACKNNRQSQIRLGRYFTGYGGGGILAGFVFISSNFLRAEGALWSAGHDAAFGAASKRCPTAHSKAAAPGESVPKNYRPSRPN